MEFFLTAYLTTACSLWILLYLYAALMWPKVPDFSRVSAHAPTYWPRLSIIISACNEADTIAAGLATLQAQDYPALEIIVVNDRSTDRTAKVVAGIAAADPRIHLINIEQLPAEWLGKVHALHIGSQHASGEWLLFCDADIHFHHDVLQRAMAWVSAQQLDHLALIPKTTTDKLLLRAIMNAFGLLFLITLRATAVSNPRSRAAIGVGAFNLVRRSMLQRTPGFTWLRMEVADDVALAHLLKQHGARTRYALAHEHLDVAWYSSVPAMAHGLEKNIVGATTRYSGSRFILNSLLLLMFAAAPLLAVCSANSTLIWLTVAILASVALLALRSHGTQATGWLLSPLGLVIFILIYIRAGILMIRRGGIVWRGTLYPLEQLRRHQRIRL